MELTHRCSLCDGTGVTLTRDPYVTPSSIPCPSCSGMGYVAENILFPEYVELLDKLDTLKTKIKKMQDDVDYIKEKVG